MYEEMPEELVLVAGSCGGSVCPLPCSDLGCAACSLWQEKKNGIFSLFLGFLAPAPACESRKNKNLHFDHGNVLIHLEAVSRVFLSPYLGWGWHQAELLLGRECWDCDSSIHK